MKSFSKFVYGVTARPLVVEMVRHMINRGLDPVRYAYLRLAEDTSPPVAAASAPAQNDGIDTDIKSVTDAVEKLLQRYGKTHVNVGKIATNLQHEVQGLSSAAQQDAQAKQAGGQPMGAPGPAPGATNPPQPIQPPQSPMPQPAAVPQR